MTKSISKKRKTVLVTGAAGHQGGAVMHSLLAAGWKVKALVGDTNEPSSRVLYRKGADLVMGDLYDRDSLDQALKGVYGVFNVQTGKGHGAEGEFRQGKNLADAAAGNAEVEHFIYSSAAGATSQTGMPFFDSKATIEKKPHQINRVAVNDIQAGIFHVQLQFASDASGHHEWHDDHVHKARQVPADARGGGPG